MVDRPIKKSELQKRAQTEGQPEGGQGRDQKARKGGRGKGRDNKERKKPAVPLALMRGPKPSAKVEEPEPVEVPEEATSEGEGTETAVAETTEAVTETTEAAAETTEATDAAADSDESADASTVSEADPAPEN